MYLQRVGEECCNGRVGPCCNKVHKPQVVRTVGLKDEGALSCGEGGEEQGTGCVQS